MVRQSIQILISSFTHVEESERLGYPLGLKVNPLSTGNEEYPMPDSAEEIPRVNKFLRKIPDLFSESVLI